MMRRAGSRKRPEYFSRGTFATPFAFWFSFPRSAWERAWATLCVAAGHHAATSRAAERPDVRSYAGAWEREKPRTPRAF